ncbi:hypothetical protein Efla_002306 [Eimeria flavescens]
MVKLVVSFERSWKPKASENAQPPPVPSDITLLEAQQQTAPRRLRFLERSGLWGVPPMYHLNYSKLDRQGMRAVLSRSYDPDSPDAATDICRRRQESIRKRVVAQNGVWVGAFLSTALVHYSMRQYDYKSKLIALPFIAYGGSWLGRWIAGGLTGRWKEWGRDRALGELPARVIYSA